MADDFIFTSEQELVIVDSPEFEDFLKKQRAAGNDRIGIEDFLSLAGNRAKWAQRFQDEAKKEQPRVYTLADIETYLNKQEEYLNDPEKADAFEDIHEVGVEDLQGFVNGSVEIEPAAYEKMDEFISVFAGYQNTPEMQALEKAAREKLATLKARQQAEQEQKVQLVEDKEGNLEYLDLTEKERDELREQYRGKEEVLDYIRRMNPTERNEDSAIDQYLMEFWKGKRTAAAEEENQDNRLDSALKRAEEVARGGRPIIVNQDDNDNDMNAALVIDQNDNDEIPHEKEGNVPPMPPREDPIEYDGFYRERSDNSDKNEEKLDKVKVVVLYEMGVINSDIMQAALKNPEKAMEAIAKRDMLKEKQQQEFGVRVSEKLLSLDNAYTEIKDADGNVVKDENGNDVRIEVRFDDLPPKVLADLYTYVKTKQENVTDDTPDGEKQKIADDVKKVAERIDDLTNQYYSGTAMPIALQAYNYDTETNIADIYDGYTDMFNVRKPDVDEQQQGVIDSCQAKLDEEIEQYDEVYGLTSIKEGDATRLSDNADKLSKRMENMSLSPELVSNLGNLKFLDENGREIPQFDADGKILPDSKLQTLVDFAKNNARIEHIGDENVSKDALSDETLQDNIDSRFYAVLRAAADEKDIFKTLDETQRNFQDDINTAALMAQLNDPDRPIEITPEGFETIKQDQVNQTMACINRIGKKVGAKGNSYLLPKLHEPIKKHDARASERFSIADPGKPTVKSWLKTFGLTTVTSVGMKAVAWGGAKLAAYGAAHTTGGTSAFLSGIGMSQVAGLAAVGLTSFAMYKNIKNFKKNNPGVSGWKAFTTAPYASQMLASGLGCAAGVCLMTGNPVGAAVCGGAALTVLGVSEYRNARKLGLSRKEAFKRSAHKLTAVAAGAFAGNWLSQQFGFTQDSIRHGEKLEDAKPGKEYHNYSEKEHSHADLRQGAAENHPNDPHTEGSRYSEYLGHDHTESSFAQNPHDIHATMQSNINSGIQGHSQFFTLGENGQEISNADVLEYKLYQLNMLAQNGDVATVDGSPVSEVFSATDANGNVTTYQDLYHNLQQPGYQMTPADLDLLGKIENGVGGQIGDGVNDMGKISVFGEIANKDGQVLSYVDKMDAGYDVVNSGGQEAVYAPDEVIKGENPSSVAYIGWVGKVKKALQRVGALADKINPFKKQKVEPLPPEVKKEEDKMIPEEKREQDKTPDIEQVVAPVLPKETKQDEQTQPVEKQSEQQLEPMKREPQPQVQKDKMLMDEYKIVHGIEPSDKEYIKYEHLVLREFQEDSKNGKTDRTSFSDYLRDRQVDFENQIFSPGNKMAKGNVSTIEERKELLSERPDATKDEKETRSETINATRETIWKAKSVEERGPDGKLRESVGGSKEIIGGKEVKDMTLKDFAKAMKHGPAFRQDNQGNRHSAGSAYGPVTSKRKDGPTH